jgi:hypothetical protein
VSTGIACAVMAGATDFATPLHVAQLTCRSVRGSASVVQEPQQVHGECRRVQDIGYVPLSGQHQDLRVR